ncbi:MAG: helix-turn-helix transcriptional regulator [Clostridia bacterium]|nr:helix-turn-helix transcriptional regulator [Clostridia bacterium]
MISYSRLWQTMKEKGISQYKLLKEYNISSGTLDKLRKNSHITTYTLENLCRILQCRIEDIVEYIPDPESPETK